MAAFLVLLSIGKAAIFQSKLAATSHGVSKMMNFVLEMINFALEVMSFVSQMMDCVLQMMNV